MPGWATQTRAENGLQVPQSQLLHWVALPKITVGLSSEEPVNGKSSYSKSEGCWKNLCQEARHDDIQASLFLMRSFPFSRQTWIIFKLQHRKTSHFADIFSGATAIFSSQKLLKLDSYTFVTQVGNPALKHTRAVCHYSNCFPLEHLLRLQGVLPLEGGGVAAKRPCFTILLAKLSSPCHHTPGHNETFPCIPTPTAILGKGNEKSSFLTAGIPSSDNTGSSEPNDTLNCTKRSRTTVGFTRGDLHTKGRRKE